MNPSWAVCRATLAHAPILPQHRSPELPGDHPALDTYAVWVEGALARGTYLGLLAEHGGEVIAGAGLTLLDWGPTRDDPSPLRARIVNVYTAPSWRRGGLARVLVEQALNEAQRLGIRTVTLGTTDMARPLYEALGFRASRQEMNRRG